MMRVLSLTVGAALLLLLAGAAIAHGPGWGMGPGMMQGGMGAGMGPGMMQGRMGPGMMGGGAGGATCPGMAGSGVTGAAAQITEERAKELAAEYAGRYLPGFTVEKVLPSSGRRHTMYSVELKGPDGEIRVLHVNPFGNVMPFGGPARRGA